MVKHILAIEEQAAAVERERLRGLLSGQVVRDFPDGHKGVVILSDNEILWQLRALLASPVAPQPDFETDPVVHPFTCALCDWSQSATMSTAGAAAVGFRNHMILAHPASPVAKHPAPDSPAQPKGEQR